MVFAVLPWACKARPTGASDSGITEERVEKQGDLHLGDDVVVENGKALFIPGKVLRVDGNTIGYATGFGNTVLDAPRSSVYAVRQHEAQEQVGDFVICRALGKFWKPCKVLSVNGSVYVCEDDDANKANLSAGDIILPSPATQTNIKERLERSAKRRSFLKGASDAGKPIRPAAWKPRAGDAIVAPYISSWYSGTIAKVAGTIATVNWDDKSSASDRPAQELVPKPKGPQKLVVGQFVLAGPSNSFTHRWSYARVVAVTPGAVTLENEDEEKRTLKDAEVIPIAR
jgi:hypothetical protein